MQIRWAVLYIAAIVGSAGHRGLAADYATDVKPILKERCLACHGPLKQEAGLRLDSGLLIRKGGDSGDSLKPGKPQASLLIQRITTDDIAQRMPPEGAPLAVDEIADITAWIAAGAVVPTDERPLDDPRMHWAFQKLTRPNQPNLASSWCVNSIDLFMREKHLQESLEPLAEADKPTLIRRLYIDLVGVPPSRGELQAFLADESADAYDKVVDRLLHSPEYGLRWGRHWMDVWRYSDWYGRRAVPDVMNSYPHIWRWRDWIVNSLNSDKGYDTMVKEMLAADELSPTDDENVVATGFIVRNWFKWNYENWMKDNVEHTSKAFLGLTLNCAHCHDHKYDPLTQEEYFRFRAFFEPLELRQDRVRGLPDPGPFIKYVYADAYGPSMAGLVRVFDEKPDAPTYMYEKGDARNRSPDREPVKPGVPAALGCQPLLISPIELPPEAFYPGLKQFVRDEELAKHQSEIVAAEKKLLASKELIATTELQWQERRQQMLQPATAGNRPSAESLQAAEQAAVDARLSYRVDQQSWLAATEQKRALATRIAADDAKYRDRGELQLLSQAAFRAEKQAAYEGAQHRIAKAEQALVLAQRKRTIDSKAATGLDTAKKELEQARAALDATRDALNSSGESYSPLSPVYPRTTTGRRLALAKWITSRENPLTARVAVNHIWLRHFGRGLVDTPSNFGRSGNPPSHPELLDWLATELLENDWRMKPIHRQIVTSRTYRLRSHVGVENHSNQRFDPDNKFLWRANRRRVEAEVVRDSLLACADELDRAIGGQEIDPAAGTTSRRRSLYFTIHGEAKMQFLELFDAPDVCDCYQRTTSVRPQQALALANGELPLDLSRSLAARLWKNVRAHDIESESETTRFVCAAFEWILSRPPTNAELIASEEFLADQLKLLNSPESQSTAAATPVGTSAPAKDAYQRTRESLIHVLFNHNDFVTVR